MSNSIRIIILKPIAMINRTKPTKLREVNKIYPPQMGKFNNQLFLYSPVEHWVETHSSKSLKDLIQIQNNPNPLYLNTHMPSELVMQSEHELWFMNGEENWLSSIQPLLQSTTTIVSKTIHLNESYLNINEQGSVNLWNQRAKQQVLPTEDISDNPQSLTSIYSKQEVGIPSHQLLKSSLNSQTLVKQKTNGFSFAQIVDLNDGFVTLHRSQYQGHNQRKRLMQTDLTDWGCQSSYYNCSLPANIKSLTKINGTICAYGGFNAYLIDHRSQTIAMNLNDNEHFTVSNVRGHEKMSNLYYMCRGNNVILMDARKTGEVVYNILSMKQQIVNCQFITQNGQEYAFSTCKNDSKMSVYQL